MYAQIGLTFLAVGICFFLPTNRRVMQLENVTPPVLYEYE